MSVRRIEISVTMLFCGAIAFIPYLPLLGEWEANTVLYTFAPEEIWLNTIIHPRANTGGYEYFPMDLARYVVAVLGYSLFSLRLLPILYGFLSLWTFFSILRTWCRIRESLLATLLLATNSVFLVFQHQLTIIGFDIFCILLCIKTYLLSRDSSRRHVIMFAGAFALTSLMYHTGRYVGLAIIAFWIVELWWKKNSEQSKASDPLVPLKVFGSAFLVIVVALNPFNLIRFFSTTFLIPEEGGAQNNEFAMTAGDLLQNLKVNLVLIANSFVGGHPFYGDFSSEIVLGSPYPLTNWPGLALALIGMVAALATRNLFILMLTGVITLVPSISQVWAHLWTSLSIYRQSFAIIPLFLLVGLGINFLGGLRGCKWVVYAGCLGLTIFQAHKYVSDISHFSEDIQRATCGFKEMSSEERKFLCTSHSERYDRERERGQNQFEETGWYFSPYANAYHIFEHTLLPHRRYATLLAAEIRSVKHTVDSRPVLVYAPTKDFVTSKTSHLYLYNYHQFFIALYLQEEGIAVNYIVPYARSLSWTERSAGFLLTRLATSQPSGGGLRISRHLNFPYPLRDGEYDLEWASMWEKLADMIIPQLPEWLGPALVPKAQPFAQFRETKGASKIYLVTTELEREYFLREFQSYTEIKL